MSDRDRRRHRRYTLQLDATITTTESDKPLHGSLLEISVGGALITTVVDVAPGDGVFIRFVYEGQHKCEATGHVVRLLPFGNNKGVAIRFGISNPPLLALIRTLGQMPEVLQPSILSAISDVHVRFG